MVCPGWTVGLGLPIVTLITPPRGKKIGRALPLAQWPIIIRRWIEYSGAEKNESWKGATMLAPLAKVTAPSATSSPSPYKYALVAEELAPAWRAA